MTAPNHMRRYSTPVPTWDDGTQARYALDNGAWSAHTAGEDFDEAAFAHALEVLGAEADWTVVPDIVAGGIKSLDFSLSWLDRVRTYGPALLAVQDGMLPNDVRGYLSSSVGIFLGGSTPWKLSSMRSWGQLAREVGCWFHVGRVNTVRRIRMCDDSGADSFDGSSVSRFIVNLHRLDNGVRQQSLLRDL
tara:strand:- start:243 stop:812 length:570 start_codon:yes stop_codon:yes gene_type:complete